MLGRLALLVAGAALALAQTTPPPTQCGVWNGATNYLCQGPVPCLDAQQHPQPCALITAPVFGVVNQCSCVTCTFNATTEACQGSCPYTRVCQLDASAPRTCACAPVQQTPSPPTPKPVPTPPPACGIYKGVGPNGAPTTLCDPPTCATNPGQLCGIFDVPTSGAAPTCACSSCTFSPANGQCSGTCPLGLGCARLAGTDTCGCGLEPTPAPTPKPPCGHFNGDTKSWLCDAPKCPDAVNPGTNVPQPRQCGILELTATGSPAECKCTTCHLDLATQRCAGKCQLGHVCTRGASGLAAETCQCRRKVHIIIVVLVGVVIGVPLVLALVASQL